MIYLNKDHSFLLDDRSTLELQNFVLQFATLLDFEINKGNWKEYLLKDISFRLVYLLSMDVNIIPEKVDKQIEFIETTQEYLLDYIAREKENPLVVKIQKDFKDLITKFLPKNAKPENLKEFYQQLKINLISAYEESLNTKSNHSPDIGLLLVFIHLYHEHLLPDINKLPSKLTQFYYESIINKKRLDALPDTVHVYFEPAKFVKKATVDKGISLYAGRDANGNNIVFKTQEAVHLSQAKLMKMRTLYFTPPDERSSQGIFKKYCFSGESYEDFETFGKNIALYRKPKRDDIAVFGFAIASKLLYLKEGVRTIRLWLPLFLSENSEDILNVLKDKCYFEITSKEGWVFVDSIAIESNNYYIKIELNLSKEFVSIEPYIEFASLPAIRCLLKKTRIPNRVHWFNQLKNAQINPEAIKLQVQVQGIKDFSCHNDLGILNIAQPFQPFGSRPTKYSRFVIGNVEAFQKPLKSITVQMDWNLPNWDFDTYFDAYDIMDIKNLNNYKIQFNHLTKEKSLFNEKLTDTGEHNSKIYAEDIEYLTPEKWFSELPSYSSDVKWGYLEMQLSSPSHPFGTGLYQQVIANQISGKNERQPNRLVNPPMIPEVRGIQLDYETKVDENNKDYQFFHIHPFGKELIEISENKEISLVTKKYENKKTKKNYQGILFLGIQRLNPGLLSLYFELAGSSLISSSSDTEIKSPSFFLVCDNKFEPLTKIKDSTEDFEQSGVIQLDIAKLTSLKKTNSILPEELNWIAIIAEENVENFGLTKSIHLHGTRAIRITAVPKYKETGAIYVDKHSIMRTLDDVPAVKAICQPSPSSKGMFIESVSSFSERVSTEIRHRYRPLSIKDIEAIIYQQFPQINQCRVFSDKKRLTIVVVPLKNTNILRPTFPISFLIKVKMYVEKLVSPFLKVLVENPHYAILQTHLFLESKENLLNTGQLEYNIKKDLFDSYLNPWILKNIPIGEVPNFNLLNSKIKEDYEYLKIKDFVFYYFYMKENQRTFHYFRHNIKNTIKSKNVIFLIDLNKEHHKILFAEQDWIKHLNKIEDKESDGTVIKGFDISFDEVSL